MEISIILYVLEDPFQSEFGFAKWNIQKNIVIANKLLVKRFRPFSVLDQNIWRRQLALQKTWHEMHENTYSVGLR